jgi:hypothetical protein
MCETPRRCEILNNISGVKECQTAPTKLPALVTPITKEVQRKCTCTLDTKDSYHVVSWEAPLRRLHLAFIGALDDQWSAQMAFQSL